MRSLWEALMGRIDAEGSKQGPRRTRKLDGKESRGTAAHTSTTAREAATGTRSEYGAHDHISADFQPISNRLPVLRKPRIRAEKG